MSNITSQDPIRFQLDNLKSTAYGVIASNANSCIDLTSATSVTKIIVSGSEPAGTSRRFAFRINDSWGKLSTAGNFEAFSVNSASFDNLTGNGNTAAELTALTNIPALAGKTFGFAIALSSTDPANVLPTASLSFSCVTNTQQLTTSQTSSIYPLGDNAQIIALNSDDTCSDGGSVEVFARTTNNDGEISDWQNLSSFTGDKAKSIQFKCDYKAATLNVSSAKLNKVSLVYASYSETGAASSGMSDGVIITKTIDWYIPVHTCRLTINHAPLINSTLKAYVTFRAKPEQVKNETLGVGTGGRKTFQLANTNGIKYDTFRLYYDNARIFSDFELNAEVGRVTCTAPEGVIISCDYQYGWDLETWHEMTLSNRLTLEDFDKSEYRFTQPENNNSVSAVKIVLGMTSGHINNEVLGTSSGTAKMFKLSHIVKDGQVTITANNTRLDSKNWILHEDQQYISIAADAGKTIRANYDWVSETPKVYQIAAVFSE